MTLYLNAKPVNSCYEQILNLKKLLFKFQTAIQLFKKLTIWHSSPLMNLHFFSINGSNLSLLTQLLNQLNILGAYGGPRTTPTLNLQCFT